MSLDSINNYGASGASSTTNSTSTTSNGTLSMDDFFQLLVAQLANQDMYNTVDDSEFMNQLAQFSMVQALADLSQASMTAYSVNLIGKEVTLATISGGTLNTYKGIVEGVNLYNGSAEIVVDGVAYSLSSIMSVKEPDIIIPDDNIPDDSDPETDDDDSSVDETNNDGSSVNETNNDGSSVDETEGGDSAGGSDEPDDSDAADETGGAEGEGDV